MNSITFASIRLGKTSVAEIKHLNAQPQGLVAPFTIKVVCTQVPQEFDKGVYVFVWLGSDNSKGIPTEWKQGYKAFGVVESVAHGERYNDESTTVVKILYVFPDAVNRLDFLKYAPEAYYYCSALPIIGLDDHSNQTIRLILADGERGNISSMFYALRTITDSFYTSLIQIDARLQDFLDFVPPSKKGLKSHISLHQINTSYRPYITAIKSKPFLLLAGISGTGKSRIVRELARACWAEDSEEFKAQKPRNFEMVQVKPNWHDSTELVGYVSRVSGKAEFVAGDFLKFVARAWQEPDVPYFLCLDEMNLAPVEQYFAEYLSVVESRKVDEDGSIKTDALLKKESEQWYYNLIARLTNNDEVKAQFLNEGIALPQNLIVVGTVNMDETTFSFSRKVLDRAMTIEMNEVDLHGGLETRHEPIGRIGAAELIGRAVEGVDVYGENKEVCDKVLTYLQSVNDVLDKEGKPFKVAYRTRNEFLLYVVNNLPYNEDEQGNTLPTDYVIARAVDEITNMKILPRIEGDDTKVTDKLLDSLKSAIESGLKALTGEEQELKSVAIAKIDEMKKRLDESGYTSYWS